MDSPNQSISFDHNSEMISTGLENLIKAREEHNIILEELYKDNPMMRQPSTAMEGVPL